MGQRTPTEEGARLGSSESSVATYPSPSSSPLAPTGATERLITRTISFQKKRRYAPRTELSASRSLQERLQERRVGIGALGTLKSRLDAQIVFTTQESGERSRNASAELPLTGRATIMAASRRGGGGPVAAALLLALLLVSREVLSSAFWVVLMRFCRQRGRGPRERATLPQTELRAPLTPSPSRNPPRTAGLRSTERS